MNKSNEDYGFSETFLYLIEDFPAGKYYNLILAELIYEENRLDKVSNGYYYFNIGDGHGFGFYYEDSRE